jgi:uncharacterized protein
MFFSPSRLACIALMGIVTLGWQRWTYPAMIWSQIGRSGQGELVSAAKFNLVHERSFATKLANAALDRPGHFVRYDSTYKKIGYPMGDVPSDTGNCADEIIRIYRDVGIDLQEQVYLDMAKTFGAYPHPNEKLQPDTNNDHRVVANLQIFFKRRGTVLSPSHNPADYLPGDVITCVGPENEPHIAMVVPSPASGARPWIVHNVGWGPALEDRLFDFAITGHYRYLPRD